MQHDLRAFNCRITCVLFGCIRALHGRRSILFDGARFCVLYGGGDEVQSFLYSFK